MSELSSRLLTGVILITGVFCGVFLLSCRQFAFFSALVFLLAAGEWARLAGIQKKISRIFYIFMNFIIILLINYYLNHYADNLRYLLLINLCLTGLACLNFLHYSQKSIKTLGIFMLPFCWQALNYLCFLSPHPYSVLKLFVIVWLSDTAAYAAGSLWGKHKLAPKISPGKSVEGALGALIAVTLLSAFLFHTWQGILAGVLTAVFSIAGDLFESLMKRRQNLKDSGKILPGHGGILDRIDSLIFAAPIFALSMHFFH